MGKRWDKFKKGKGPKVIAGTAAAGAALGAGIATGGLSALGALIAKYGAPVVAGAAAVTGMSPAAVKAIGAASVIGGAAYLGGKKINDAVQASNRAQGKPQGETSKLLYGEDPNNPENPNYGIDPYSNRTPEQQQLMHKLGGLAEEGLTNNRFDFAPIKQNALNTFYSDVVPKIEQKYSHNNWGNSAIGKEIGSAGAGLSSKLAALEADYGQRQQGHNINLAELALKPQYEGAIINQGNNNFRSQLGSALGSAAGKYGTSLIAQKLFPLKNPAMEPISQSGL